MTLAHRLAHWLGCTQGRIETWTFPTAPSWAASDASAVNCSTFTKLPRTFNRTSPLQSPAPIVTHNGKPSASPRCAFSNARDAAGWWNSATSDYAFPTFAINPSRYPAFRIPAARTGFPFPFATSFVARINCAVACAKITPSALRALVPWC